MMLRLKHILILFSLVTIFACGGTKQFFSITDSRAVETFDFESDSKSLLMLGMSDLAPADFYEDAIVKIELFKREGYVLYYEDWGLDSLSDIEIRQLKKVMGVLPTMDAYVKYFKEKIEEGYLPNDIEYLLMIENYDDYPIDMDAKAFLAHYQKTYGEVVLSVEDKAADTNEKWTDVLPRKRYEKLIGEWRHHKTAEKIVTSEDERMMLIYDKRYKTPLLEWLKKMDATWK